MYMEINEFIKKFSSQFEDTDPSLFNESLNYRDLEEWSSLIALSVIAMIDEEYNVTIKGDDLRLAANIGQLFTVVKSKA